MKKLSHLLFIGFTALAFFTVNGCKDEEETCTAAYVARCDGDYTKCSCNILTSRVECEPCSALCFGSQPVLCESVYGGPDKCNCPKPPEDTDTTDSDSENPDAGNDAGNDAG